MTEPTPPPTPLGWPENNVIWCVRCEIHYATPHKPLCIGCVDEETRTARPVRSLADLHEIERADPAEWYERHTLDHP